EIGEPGRIRPGAGRIARGDDEIAAAIDAGVEDVEEARVVRDRRRKQAARPAESAESEHFGTVDRIADLGPARQVAAAEDRDARKPGEGGIDQIIEVADSGE